MLNEKLIRRLIRNDAMHKFILCEDEEQKHDLIFSVLVAQDGLGPGACIIEDGFRDVDIEDNENVRRAVSMYLDTAIAAGALRVMNENKCKGAGFEKFLNRIKDMTNSSAAGADEWIAESANTLKMCCEAVKNNDFCALPPYRGLMRANLELMKSVEGFNGMNVIVDGDEASPLFCRAVNDWILGRITDTVTVNVYFSKYGELRFGDRVFRHINWPSRRGLMFDGQIQNVHDYTEIDLHQYADENVCDMDECEPKLNL